MIDTTVDMHGSDECPDLAGTRVLAALNGTGLFGQERGNIEVFKALQKCGAEVCVGVNETENGGSVAVELDQLGFATFPIPFGFQWSKAFFRKHPLLILRNLNHVRRSNRAFAIKLRQFRPTHIHLGNPLAYSFVSRAIRRSEVPLVVRLGDLPPVNSSVQMIIWRRFINASRVAVANSRYVWKTSAAASTALGSREPVIIPNLAPTGMQEPTPALFDPKFRHVIYVGQLAREKGVFEFVRAAALLLAQNHDLCFHLVGGSPYSHAAEDQLQALIAELSIGDRITLHGWVNNAQDFFAKAAVHVAPSLWEEPFANVVLEGKREGVPSVIFPSGGLPEMIQHEVNGFICRGKSAEALAEGIHWVLTKGPEELRRLREAVVRDHHERFGEERFREAWAEVYRHAQS